jgi:ABC-type transport system involved in Fe-S cluster assembly, permease and ATPase components
VFVASQQHEKSTDTTPFSTEILHSLRIFLCAAPLAILPSYYQDPPPAPQNTHGWQTLSRLAPYLWQHKWRVLFSFACLVAAKMANVGVPIVFKNMIDELSGTAIAVGLPILLLALYGTLRFANSLFTELREILFARVTQEAVRRISLEVFRHLHALSLRFHLERQTGGMSRDIERGNRSISSLITYALYSIVEELIFRGVIMHGLMRNYSKSTAIFASALMFALFHLNPWQFPATFILGLLLGLLMVRTNNIILCIIGHAINNGLVLISIQYAAELQNTTFFLSGKTTQLLLSFILSVVALVFIYITTASANPDDE